MDNASLIRLKPAIRLLKESWFFYFSKIKTILGITIIPVGFIVLGRIFLNSLALTDVVYSFWFSFFAALISLASPFLSLLAVLSLLYSFKENIGTGDSYRKGIQALFSYIKLYLLLIIIISGGFLFFIVPGVIFSVWLSLSFLVFVFEGKSGFSALYKSRQLVRGKFLRVFWRFLLFGLIVGVPLFLIAFLTADKLGGLFNYLVYLFVLPFFLVYTFLIYKDLSETKPEIIDVVPSKTTKILYGIPAVPGAFIVGLLIALSFFNIFWGRDIPPIDDSDLQLTKVEIAEEENAFFLFSQIAEKLDIIPEREDISFHEMALGEKWDSEFARELIDRNQEVFELFEKALDLPYFQVPEWQNPEAVSLTTVIPHAREIRELGQLNIIKANYLFKEGKEEEALDLTIKTIKMGQMLQDMLRPSLITYLVGSSIKENVLSGLRSMISDLTLPSETLKQYVAELEQFKENEEGLVRAMKMEYIALSNTIDGIRAGIFSEEVLWSPETDSDAFYLIGSTPQLHYLYKPNQTQQIFAEYSRNNVNNAKKDCYQIEPIEIEQLVSPHYLKLIFTENVIGKMLHDVVAVSNYGVFDQKCSEDFSIMGTQILMATKAFQADTGNLPASLYELVPEYLSEVSKDPFSGEAISYSVEEKTIYSSQEGIIFPIGF